MIGEAEREILNMVQRGDISAQEGLRLMEAMSSDWMQDSNLIEDEIVSETNGGENPVDDQDMQKSSLLIDDPVRIKQIKRWWLLPFGIGLLFIILGTFWMYTSFMAKGFGAGFWLSWVPFIAGIFTVAVSWQASNKSWLHVRIRQKPGEKPQHIAISLPLPISFTRWLLKTFGNHIPGLRDLPVNDYADILNNFSPAEPFYVHVNEDSEEVVVFIG